MKDLAIISLPRLDLTRPAIAPAILSSLADEMQVTNQVFDFALKTYEQSTKEDWNEFELYWQVDLKYELSKQHKLKLDKLFDQFVTDVLALEPKMIAISVFSHNSINATTLFLEKVRLKSNAKIIVGGQGIQSKIGQNKTYAETLREKGLIDVFCSGEAETTFTKALAGEEGPGVNNWGWSQMENLDLTPVPNYKHYDLDNYHHLVTGKSLWINGSRGCVRRCDFCDIGKRWKKFRFRSGESIFHEMSKQIIDHDINSFQFADALINGSLKSFTDTNVNLIKGIESKQIHRPLFGGHFIVRPSSQMSEEHYKVAKQAGLDYISIGVETGSDELRWRMNKKFTNDDVAYHLEMCRKYEIKNLFLMFCGHPTETLADHKKTLEMFKRFRRYAAYGTISGVEVANASIIDDTPLAHWAMEHKMIYSNEGVRGDNKFWYNQFNPTLTLSERIRRQLEVYETAINMGWPMNQMTSSLKYMKRLLVQAKENNFAYY